MKYFLVFLVFAIGEITIGEALMCKHCRGVNGKDCSGVSLECPNKDDVCTQAIEQNILHGDLKPTMHRGCLNNTIVCNQIILVDSGSFKLNIYNKCCKTEDCNSDKIEMPPINTTENGVYCKSCFVEGSYKCEKYVPIACTCNQRDCIEFNGDAARPGDEEKKYALAGCATKGACEIGFGALIGTSVGNVRSLTCPKENRICSQD